MTGNAPWIIPLLVALTGPVFLLIRSARQFSGQIQTTDAAKLWDESSKMREEYRTRIQELTATIESHRARITDLEHRNDVLEKENRNLENVISKLERELRHASDS